MSQVEAQAVDLGDPLAGHEADLGDPLAGHEADLGDPLRGYEADLREVYVALGVDLREALVVLREDVEDQEVVHDHVPEEVQAHVLVVGHVLCVREASLGDLTVSTDSARVEMVVCYL